MVMPMMIYLLMTTSVYNTNPMNVNRMSLKLDVTTVANALFFNEHKVWEMTNCVAMTRNNANIKMKFESVLYLYLYSYSYELVK